MSPLTQRNCEPVPLSPGNYCALSFFWVTDKCPRASLSIHPPKKKKVHSEEDAAVSAQKMSRNELLCSRKEGRDRNWGRYHHPPHLVRKKWWVLGERVLLPPFCFQCFVLLVVQSMFDFRKKKKSCLNLNPLPTAKSIWQVAKTVTKHWKTCLSKVKRRLYQWKQQQQQKCSYPEEETRSPDGWLWTWEVKWGGGVGWWWMRMPPLLLPHATGSVLPPPTSFLLSSSLSPLSSSLARCYKREKGIKQKWSSNYAVEEEGQKTDNCSCEAKSLGLHVLVEHAPSRTTIERKMEVHLELEFPKQKSVSPEPKGVPKPLGETWVTSWWHLPLLPLRLSVKKKPSYYVQVLQWNSDKVGTVRSNDDQFCIFLVQVVAFLTVETLIK